MNNLELRNSCVTTARTLNPTLEWHDIHSDICCANHLPVSFVSGKALMTNEIYFFNKCNNILGIVYISASTFRQLSNLIFLPFHVNLSLLCCNLFSSDIDGKGNLSRSSLYD